MRAKINGIDLCYEDFGVGEPVLLTHGYSATLRMWEPQRRPLEERYRLITWDMRGHGETEYPTSPDLYSAELTVGDMAGLLDHIEIEKAVIGGLSLGGYMSLAFYHAHPQRVRALILCNTGPGYRNPEARAKWNAAAYARAQSLEEKGLDVLGDASPERRESRSRHRSAQGLVHAARGMLAQSNDTVINLLPKIDVPTLVIVGNDDEAYLVPCRYMAQKIPNARLEVIPDAGHASNLDQPERFNEVVLDFLSGLD